MERFVDVEVPDDVIGIAALRRVMPSKFQQIMGVLMANWLNCGFVSKTSQAARQKVNDKLRQRIHSTTPVTSGACQ